MQTTAVIYVAIVLKLSPEAEGLSNEKLDSRLGLAIVNSAHFLYIILKSDFWYCTENEHYDTIVKSDFW